MADATPDPVPATPPAVPAADPATPAAAAPAAAGETFSWSSPGEGETTHLVHVAPAGMAWALKLKSGPFGELAAAAGADPANAQTVIGEHKNGTRLPKEKISKVTYAKDLNQLAVHDDAGKRTKIPDGKTQQAAIFESVGRHLGGSPSEEDADAWSVMQTPLFVLAVIGVIGGFLIFMAAQADPDYEPTGRRSGMKRLINWLGLTVGPTWMSAIVGTLAAIVLGLMIFQLVKRPVRKVLTF